MTSELRRQEGRFHASAQLLRALGFTAALGAAVTLAGLAFAPGRTWPNLLLAAYYFLGLGLGAAIFIAMQYVSNAGWAVAIRRVPEAMMTTLPVAGLLMLALLFGLPSLYEWARASTAATGDPAPGAASGWLNVPFFALRMVLFLAAWIVLALAIVRTSRKQDEDGLHSLTKRNVRLGAFFLVLFGLSFTLASMDWIMSLEPHWYSTIFGIYNFSGMFLSSLAMMTLIVILMKRMGPFRHIVSSLHVHSLGKLVFAFSTFWMYIWFSQYLLIWYANIPEEATYFVHRERGSWLVFTVVNVLFNWAIPFVVLLPSWTKRNEGLLFKVCVLVLVGRWIDLFWMILPPFMPAAPYVNIWELGPMIGMMALFFLLTFRALARASAVPLRDPYLVESLAEEHV